MKDEVSSPKDLLSLRRLPARLNYFQTAAVLGFSEHDIPVIVRAKLLKPLGKPAPNAPKYFAAHEVEIPTQPRTTFYTRHGDWLSIVAMIVTALTAFVPMLRKPRS